MHLLETNASTNPLQWFMDSPKVQKSENNLEMIQASSHIETTLPSPVSERLTSGINFSTPSSSAFPDISAPFYGRERTDLCTRYKSVDSILPKFPSPNLKVPSSNAHEDRPTKVYPNCHWPSSGNDCSPTRKMKYSSSCQDQQEIIPNLNGVIKGFIVKAKQRNDESAQDGDVTPKNESEKKSLARNRNNVEVNVEDRDDQPISSGDYGSNEFSNTQNILTQMYASFGANALRNEEFSMHSGKLQRKERDASLKQTDSRQPRVPTSSRPEANYCNGDSSRKTTENGFRGETYPVDSPVRFAESLNGKGGTERKRRRGREDGMQECSRHTNKRRVNQEAEQGFPSSHPAKHLRNHPTNPTKRQRHCSNSKRTQSESLECSPGDSSPVRNGYSMSPTRVLHRETSHSNNSGGTKAKTSYHSPGHTIDSLLCREQKCNSPVRRRSQEEHIQTSPPFRHIPPRHMSPPLPQREATNTPNSPPSHPRPIPKGRIEGLRKREVMEDGVQGFQSDRYNEKAREVFMREKEMIENSLRQNGQVPLGMSQSPYLHNPYMMNPGALAAFQNSLLSSIHPGAAILPDPGMALKTASLAAAASANPLLLGLNQYFSNPFLLRSLIGNGLQGVAYGQALTQGLLPPHSSIIPLLNAMPGNPSISQAMNPLLYGGPPESHIAAAIASSSYPHGGFPYSLPPHVSPSLLENHGKTVEMDNSAREVEVKNLPVEVRPVLVDAKKNIAKNSPGARRRSSGGKDDKFLSGCKAKKEDARRRSPDVLVNRCNVHNFGKTSRESNDRSTILPQVSGGSFSRSPNNIKVKRKQASTLPNPLPKKLMKLDKTYAKPSTDRLSPTKILDSLQHKKEKEAMNTGEKNDSPFDKTSRPASYKNLTRERRLVANARERTRVHTISSAFEDLRQNIPSYSCNQKLSKLAILRIACSYIRSLSVLAGRNTEDTFSESVEQCTHVLQAESRARSRRKTNKAQIEWEVAHYEKGADCGTESGDTPLPPVSAAQSRSRAAANNSSPHESREQVCNEGTSPDSAKFPREDDFSKQTTIHQSTDSFDDRSGILSANRTGSGGGRLNSFAGFIKHSAVTENAGETFEMVRFHSDDAADTWCDDEAPRKKQSPTSDHPTNHRVDSPSAQAEVANDNSENGETESPEDPQNDLINVED